MRRLWSTLALLLVLVGLGAYIYFVSSKQTDSSAPKRDKVFASLDADQVDEIQIDASSGDKTTVKKENGGWQMTAPIATKADEAEISGVTRNLSTLEMTRVVDENPSDLKDYGLATPRIRVEFKTSGGKPGGTLLVGEKSPTGGDLFVKRDGEKRVFLIPAYQEAAFNRGTFDLRDKTVLHFDRAKVDGVELVAEGHTIQLTKGTNEWKIVKPGQGKADFGTAEGLLTRMQSTQAKSFVAADATAADVKKYGLDKPAVTINLNAGSEKTTFVIGNKTADNTYYARDASKPVVVTVDAALVDELKRGVDTYRLKDVFVMRSYTANKLDLVRGSEIIVFDMTPGEGDKPGKWRRVSPNPADVDKEKMDAFLSKLTALRGIGYVDSLKGTGLDKPVLTVTDRFNQTSMEIVGFGKTDTDVFAGRQDETGALKLDPKDFEEVTKALDEIAK
jgi:hypothetical protein